MSTDKPKETVQRYEMEWCGHGHMQFRDLVPNENGDWIMFDDHAAIVAALERRLQQAVQALGMVLDVISDEHGWGTVSRMEGSYIYSEASAAKKFALPILRAEREIDSEHKEQEG